MAGSAYQAAREESDCASHVCGCGIGIEDGLLRVVGEEMAVGCGGRSSVLFDEVQMEGKRRNERCGVPAWVSGEERREAWALSGARRDGERLRGKPGMQARPVSAGPTVSQAEAIAKISPARAAAFEILTLVAADKGHSDELLHSDRGRMCWGRRTAI